MNFGKRVEEELYDVSKDPFCINNLAADPAFSEKKEALKNEMEAKLLAQGDLRMQGFGHLYEQAPFLEGRGRGFYEDFIGGKKPKAGWVNDSDFEPYMLDGDGNESNKIELPIKD